MRRPLTAATLLLTAGLAARGQCPDGSPPPCRSRPAAPVVITPITTRRANPPLDDATWIVLPFDNLAKAPDVDWLRDASVNLLYLDLSKWSDIHVVDDERVADLLREVPEAQGKGQLSLAAGIAVARRAGAGKLVMGDVLKVGSTTAVTAKVFDVRGGQRIRTVREESQVQDSLMPSFGKLARGILNVAPPAGTNIGEIGTQNTAAYQDYLGGVKALNRFDLKTARRAFDSALLRDSTFALAHYKLAILIGWETPGDESKAVHARAAARFSSALPQRERTLASSLLSFDTGEYGRACAGYGSLVRADSTDIEALYGMGECLFHDNVVSVVNGDTTNLRYRGSYNKAIAAFRRVLELDPTYHLAFQHVLDAYINDGRAGGCRLRDTTSTRVDNANTSCVDTYTSITRLDGDTLITLPVSVRNTAAIAAQTEAARIGNARRARIGKAREYANRWVESGPSEPRALSTLARIDLLLGDVVAADTLLSKARLAELDENEGGRALVARVEIMFKLGRLADFARAIDSNYASHPAAQSATFTANALAVMGRMTMLDSIIASAIQKNRIPVPPTIGRYLHSTPRVVLGATPDSVVEQERGTFDTISGSRQFGTSRRTATLQIMPTLAFGLRIPRAEWPAIDTTFDRRLVVAAAVERKDTAALRTAARVLDSVAHATTAMAGPDDGSYIAAADGYLLLGDSTAALATVRDFLSAGIGPTPMFNNLGGGFAATSFLWPRAVLLRADLEAAKGDKQVAREYYKRFLALWSKADPEFQPIVARARAALAVLGPGL